MAEEKLILASASPRRAELLRAMGLDIMVITSNAVEAEDGEPELLAMDNAKRKAFAIFDNNRRSYVLGADTIVVLDGIVYGKPRDVDDAFRMLKILQGRTHNVITGVCLYSPNDVICEYDTTSVTFAAMTDQEIMAYLRTNESMDKAGAYGIQGMMRMYVELITGSYDNVMGLPTARVRRMLTKAGFMWLKIY